MIYFLSDDLPGDERLAEVRRGCGEPDLVVLNTSVFEGPRLDLAELVAAASAVPFLAEKRLVIVRRFLGSGAGSGAAEARADDAEERRRGADPVKALLEWLPRVPPTTELVLVDDRKPEDRARPGGAASQVRQAVVRLGGEAPEPRRLAPEEAADWLVRRARERGGRLDSAAAQALAEAVGEDLRRADAELDKLLTYADGATVTPADVRLLVSEARDENVFHLVDAVGQGDQRQALGVLHDLLAAGAPVPYLLTMITRQLRLLLQVREALGQSSDPQQVASALRLRPWQARNLIGQARRFSLAELEGAYRRLLATDQAIKTGRLRAEVAVDLLVAELTGGRVGPSYR